MKHNDFIKTEYDKFFNHVDALDFTEKKQIVTFLKWCFKNRFFDNISDEDFEYFYEDTECLRLPLLRTKDITIGVDYWTSLDKRDNYCRVGIDPTRCFNKISQCSIVMHFPITSKREEKRFYDLLNTLLDKKSTISKEWFQCASSEWYGAYMRNY